MKSEAFPKLQFLKKHPYIFSNNFEFVMNYILFFIFITLLAPAQLKQRSIILSANMTVNNFKNK